MDLVSSFEKKKFFKKEDYLILEVQISLSDYLLSLVPKIS